MKKFEKNNLEKPIEAGVKIKWFKQADLKELQEAIDKGKFKIRKQVDIRDRQLIRIDHVTIRIGKTDVHYELQETTNNNYMAEWRKSSAGFIRQDIKKGRIISPLDLGYYSEIIYSSSKDKTLKKALIRFYPEQWSDMSKEFSTEFFENQESLKNIHGILDSYKFSIIKIVGAEEDYSKPEILTKTDENLEDLATTDFKDYESSEDEETEVQTQLF